MHMETVKTLITFSGFDEGRFHLVDTIWHDNAWWLVSTWLQNQATGHKTPERIVRLSGLRYQELTAEPYRFVLNNAVPISVFEGKQHDAYVIAVFPALGKIQTDGPAH